MQACFIGHRTIEQTENLVALLRKTIKTLIDKDVTTFLFGSKSAFDSLAWRIVTELKTEFSTIKRVYVRSSFQHIDKSYEEYLQNFYEETYFLPKLAKAGKYSYVERNYEMIDKSSYCIFYYNKNYSPPLKTSSKNNMLLPTRSNSGTKIAFNYATKKKKIIINLYKTF